MNFTQSAFFVLLAFALASVAVTTRTEIRKLIILGCSFVFYGWWDWRFLGLVLVSTTIDFLAGLLIKSARRNDDRVHRETWPYASRSAPIFSFSVSSNISISSR